MRSTWMRRLMAERRKRGLEGRGVGGLDRAMNRSGGRKRQGHGRESLPARQL